MSLSNLSRAIVRVQKKHGIRKERIGEESTWMLSRFYPILEPQERHQQVRGEAHAGRRVEE
ncbi:hypothetical protein ACQJBY_032743 [Aegilops geniculata]